MRKSIFLPLCAVTLALSACSDDDGAGAAFDDREIITDYADRVVIPTYQLLAQRAQALDAAIAALAATPSQASLTAARQAWVATRVPWEQSEAHLFGPVSASGYDPAMDSWPVNRTDLDAVLASGNALTQAYVSALPEEQKGFHTLEYLLWGESSDKPAAALTARRPRTDRATTAHRQRADSTPAAQRPRTGHRRPRKASSASRSTRGARRKASRARSASPPCHKIASASVRARPSCRPAESATMT